MIDASRKIRNNCSYDIAKRENRIYKTGKTSLHGAFILAYSIGPIFLEHGQSYKKVYLFFSGVYNVVSVLDIEHILIRKPLKKKPQLFGL